MLVFMPSLNLAINTWSLKARNPVLQASPNPDGMLVFMPALYLAITSWNLMTRNPVLQASPNPDEMLVFMPALNLAITTWSLKARTLFFRPALIQMECWSSCQPYTWQSLPGT
jgi:hypothetical protein